MKSCFNIFRGFIAFIFVVIYWLFLSISFFILPISFILKDAKSLNIALDDVRIEEQFVYLVSGTPNPEVTELSAEEQIPELDLYSLFEDEEIQKELIDTRRTIVIEAYKSINTKKPMEYQVDLEFFNTLYMGVMRQYYEGLPVCNTWPTGSNVELSMDTGCLPAPIAYANGIELPEGITPPAGYQSSDILLLDNIVDYEAAVEEGVAELPVIRMEQDVVDMLNPIVTILDNYIIIFVLTFFALSLAIIVTFPNIKAILIMLGILNFLSSVVAIILWTTPSIFMDNAAKSMEEQGFSGEYFELFGELAINVASKALIACASIGIIGLIFVIAGIILPKKKHGEQREEQPSGKDNSTK